MILTNSMKTPYCIWAQGIIKTTSSTQTSCFTTRSTICSISIISGAVTVTSVLIQELKLSNHM